MIYFSRESSLIKYSISNRYSTGLSYEEGTHCHQVDKIAGALWRILENLVIIVIHLVTYGVLIKGSQLTETGSSKAYLYAVYLNRMLHNKNNVKNTILHRYSLWRRLLPLRNLQRHILLLNACFMKRYLLKEKRCYI